MTVDPDKVGLFLVVVVVIQGIWLAGLTYLMWRRHLREKRLKEQEAQKKMQTPPA